MREVRVTRWDGEQPVTEEAVRGLLAAEDLSGMTWSNGPGDTYAAHEHDFFKVIYVVAGSINLSLPDSDFDLQLGAGDRLDLPAGKIHSAVVGPEGVICLEAHRQS